METWEDGAVKGCMSVLRLVVSWEKPLEQMLGNHTLLD